VNLMEGDRSDALESDAPVARALWRDASDIAVEVTADGIVGACNPAARRFFGGEPASVFDVVHPQDAPRLLKLLARDITAPAKVRVAEQAPASGWRTIEVAAVSGPWDAEGTLTIIARDITTELRAGATLDALRRVLDLLAGGEPIPAVLDALARAVAESSGGARVAVLIARGSDLELVAAPNLRADAAAAFSRLAGAALPDAFPAPGALSGSLAEASQAHRLGFGWAAPVLDGDQPRAVLLLFPGSKRFPTAAEQAALESAVPLARIALASEASRTAFERADRLDPLTGVLSRHCLLGELAKLGRRTRDTLGLLLIAVDDLAEINEGRGRETADAVLQAVGRRLGSVVRRRDLVGRASANRFAIVCLSGGDPETLERFAARVREVMAQPFEHLGQPVEIKVRVVVATHRGRIGEPAALLVDAERALRALRDRDAGPSAPARPDGEPGTPAAAPVSAPAADPVPAAGENSSFPKRPERRARRSGSPGSVR
jgi:diguanylate cyclase (GGDEF)-like protein